ncbi:hypothetical protein VHEMI05794 [[Torrubiella] hemipterigena]|uniref:GrpB domain protein n=1 Tax=[Torrubiella] hemipterigena TaxID=1531966 RepID=A0A0A1SYU3_9HYPO|nr:hypothetical protein VHEMI05794 [[Torrubiella] hemipterigena]
MTVTTPQHVGDTVPISGGLQILTKRTVPLPLEVVQPDPTWPAQFAGIKAEVEVALGSELLDIVHVGSTSVPDLPAKPVIDIDVTVANIEEESTYAPAFEAAGFQFILRDPSWNQHRLFYSYDPPANLHVFGPDSKELIRHAAFRDWLLTHPEDRETYAKIKIEASKAAIANGEDVNQYNDRKSPGLQEILVRALAAVGHTLESTYGRQRK